MRRRSQSQCSSYIHRGGASDEHTGARNVSRRFAQSLRSALPAHEAHHPDAVPTVSSGTTLYFAGLLHNWGVGLYELGTQALAASDPATAASALAEATSRLEASISFNRADAAPMNALGDVWLARAEQAADVQAAAAAAGAALETGYGAALRVLATDSDALIGRAEAHTLLARLTSQTGDGASSSTHYQQSYEAYRTALQRPTALGSLDDRCNVPVQLCVRVCRAWQA